ncbi:MAG: helix-turn-helix domain-containing protein [Candidatus Obscuribacterales bacterium]|nr:helix-turn-helix domain-containing protein [Candidatus Obscuribacterales bacterium]
MSKSKPSHLGQFLRLLREQRGYDSIQDYAQKYQLPVSYAYYTEIESGKKKIAPETSKQLCEALEVDFVSFYYHLLQDILPAEIQDDYLNLVPLHKVTDRQELANREARIKEAYQKNQLSRLSSANSIMSEQAEAYFFNNPRLHALVAAIYCVSSTTDVELEIVYNQLGVTTPFEEVISKFKELGIIEVLEGQPRIIKRFYDIIVTNDQRTISSIVGTETEKVIQQMQASSSGSADDPSCAFGIVGLTKDKQEEFRAFLADLDAEFDSYHLQDSDAEPQLMTVVFSPVREYTL